MCDCYWEKCKLCDVTLPVHISDFCMARDEIEVYCGVHLPSRDILIYELVEDEGIHDELGPDDHFAGWKMGVKYLVDPPRGYGLQAVEPNLAATYLAEYIDKKGKKSYFISSSGTPISSQRMAARNALQFFQDRIKENKEDEPEKWLPYLENEKDLWERIYAQQKARDKTRIIFNRLEPVIRLKQQDKLIAGILIGSLANREYVPGLSDIDFLVIGKNLKRDLKVEYFKLKEIETDINIVCRSPGFFEKSLLRGNPVDLIALRYGEILYDKGGYIKCLRKKSFSPTKQTVQSWLKTGLHHFGELMYQYFSPCCNHCFFRALYHSSRELLRALLLEKGEDALEGWELKASVGKHYPGLFPEYIEICRAREKWDKYQFPLFDKRIEINGQLGTLVHSAEAIAREALKSQGLNLPPINDLLKEIKDLKSVNSIHISIPEKELLVLFYDQQDNIQSKGFTL